MTEARLPGPGESLDTQLGWTTNTTAIITLARGHAGMDELKLIEYSNPKNICDG